jgi:hypothetical protein
MYRRNSSLSMMSSFARSCAINVSVSCLFQVPIHFLLILQFAPFSLTSLKIFCDSVEIQRRKLWDYPSAPPVLELHLSTALAHDESEVEIGHLSQKRGII